MPPPPRLIVPLELNDEPMTESNMYTFEVTVQVEEDEKNRRQTDKGLSEVEEEVIME